MPLGQRLSGWLHLTNSIPGSNPPSDDAFIYSDAGVAKVRQGNGTVITIAAATTVDAGTWSGGNASTTFTGQPLLRAGGAS